MKWLQLISDSKSTHNKLVCFLNQYGLSGLEDALQTYENSQQYYFCNTRSSCSKIRINDIYYLKIKGHTINVYTTSEIYKKYGTLNSELKTLSPCNFIKCHQSYIVSLEKVKTIHNNKIILLNGDLIPLSRYYAPQVMMAFHNYTQKYSIS